MEQIKGRYCKDCVVFSDTLEQDARSIIYGFADHSMFEGVKIRIMPDVHAGKDIVVGFTAPFRDFVNPDHIGGDIGCTVSTTITGTPVNPGNYAEIERRIRENVKFGMALQERSRFKNAELYAHIKQRLQEAQLAWSEYVMRMDISEKGILGMLSRMGMNPADFFRQVGTVGGGNHFIEIGVTPEGNYAVTVHCGRHSGSSSLLKNNSLQNISAQ